jgi:hypothetical protein
MKSTLASIVLGTALVTMPSCTYLRPEGKPIYDSMVDSVNQNDGRYSIPSINLSGVGLVQPEISDRVAEGELAIMFKPLGKGTKIVKDRTPARDVDKRWPLETETIYVTPTYMVGGNPATEATYEIGGRFGIPVEVSRSTESGMFSRTFDQSNHKYNVKTMLLDHDRNPETPKVEFYFPVVRDAHGVITATLMIDSRFAKEVVDWQTGQLTLRTSPGDIRYLKAIPASEYLARPLPEKENVKKPEEEVESPSVIVK